MKEAARGARPRLPVAILAGGKATRLRPMTETTPKILLDVNGRPFIAHLLNLLRSQDVARVVLCVGHLSESIVEAVGSGTRFGLDVEYSFDGPAPLGTAGALRRALPRLGESFFVLHGDAYLECPLAAIQSAFEASEKLALMTVYRNESRWGASNVEFSDGRILAYDKREPNPRMKHIDYGLGVCRRAAFERLPESGAHDLEPLYQGLLEENQLEAFEVASRFYEIGSTEGLEETRRYLAADPHQETR